MNHSSASITPISVDFSECENEPIHALGTCQNFAALIAVHSASQKVTAVSANIQDLLGLKARQILGWPFSEVRSSLGLSADVKPVNPQLTSFAQSEILTVVVNAQSFYVFAHCHDGHELWEFEPVSINQYARQASGKSELRPWQNRADRLDDISLFRACQFAAEEFRNLTGFDRVMVYRFHADGSGDVVAEVKQLNSVSYLGLRFPATDIPQQVRKLFLLNPVREIVDVFSQASPLIQQDLKAILDCTYARCRSVSPYHLQYLQNMGVRASIGCALVVEGKLWGLLIGHHALPYKINPFECQQAFELSQQLSQCIAHKLEALTQLEYSENQLIEQSIRNTMSNNQTSNLLGLLFSGEYSPLIFADACGLAVKVDEDFLCVGNTPSVGDTKALLKWIDSQQPCDVDGDVTYYHTHQLPEALQVDHTVRGVFAVYVRLGQVTFRALLFRPEHANRILWGGDPTVSLTLDINAKLQPRNSFSLWCQSVKGVSTEWQPKVLHQLRVFFTCLIQQFNSARLKKEFFEIVASVDEMHEFDRYFMRYLFASVGKHKGILILEIKSQVQVRVQYTNQTLREYFGLGHAPYLSEQLLQILNQQGCSVGSLLQNEKQVVELWGSKQGQILVEIERMEGLSTLLSGQERHFFVYVFHDVTLEVRTLEALKAAKDQANLAVKSQRDMLGNVTHELRTPLNAVIGLTQLLQMSAPLNDEQTQYLKEIGLAGNNLLQMVNHILDLSSLESGELKLNNETQFDLIGLLNEVINLNRDFAEASSVFVPDIAVDHSNHYQLIGDYFRIRQAFIQVIHNAIKYSVANGRIGLQIVAHDDHCLKVIVSDTGVGIPVQELPRIFDRYYRVKQQHGYHQGAGIGLSLVKMFMELHGGSIGVKSQEGVGTCVTLSFPKSRVIDASQNFSLPI